VSFALFVFCVCLQITIWDLSMERDEEAEREAGVRGDDVTDFPVQLMFDHRVRYMLLSIFCCQSVSCTFFSR
jgi:hypothetical protein